MRIILFFDLPMDTLKQKRVYVKFLKSLKRIGFVMLQKSVYVKLSINESNVEMTKKIIKTKLPNEGIVSILVITETQFSTIEHLIGEFNTDVLNTEDRIVEI